MGTMMNIADEVHTERGSYRLERLLGVGGMGEVWEAMNLHEGPNVAIKFMRDDGHVLRARFNRETTILRSLRHPNVVRYIDHGETDDGRPFVVLELLSGETLHAWLKRSRVLPIRTAIEIAMAVAAALGAAHARGIVHRDLKPGNVFLHDDQGTQGGRIQVVVIDFGIAKNLGASGQTCPTAAGSVLGTPGYMSPEQHFGKDVDYRTDFWALGMLLIEMIEGRSRPRSSRRAFKPPVLPIRWSTPGVPKGLDVLLARCLEPSVSKRISRAWEIEQRLAELLVAQESATSAQAKTTDELPRTDPSRVNDSLPSLTNPPWVMTKEEHTRMMAQQHREAARLSTFLQGTVIIAVVSTAINVALVLSRAGTVVNVNGPCVPCTPSPSPASDAASAPHQSAGSETREHSFPKL